MLLVSLLWRLPSFFDPPWVNDEGTYFAVAGAMAHGYPLYTGIWENKPPALYLLYGAVYHSFGPSLIAIRLLTACAVLLLVWRSWHLSTYFLGHERAAAVATVIGLVFGIPFLEGTTGNAEIFIALLSVVAVEQALIRDRWWLAGLAMGLGVLFKVVAVFDMSALMLALYGAGRSSDFHAPPLRSAIPYVGWLLFVVGGACILAWWAGILHGMIDNAVLYDVGYVSHGNGGVIPVLLPLKAAVLGAAILLVWKRPFPFMWAAFALAGALFSGRVFGHYLLQPVVPVVLSAATLLPRKPRVSVPFPVIAVAVTLACACVASLLGWILAVSGHDSILARRLQYYPNFARYALRFESRTTYEAQIDDHVRRNETIARRLTHLAPGRLLVWGNTPWIYPLSGRLPATPYTSAVRSPEVPGESAALRSSVRHASPALVVVVFPAAPPLRTARSALHKRYGVNATVANAVIYERKSTR